MRFVNVGIADQNRQIAVLNEGQGAGFFWLGGFRSSMAGLKAAAMVDFARSKGLGSTRFDYSGHGESGGAFEDGTISCWLEESLAVFKETAGRQVLVGSSMGAWLALLLARAHIADVGYGASRVAGIVLIAPAWDMTEELMWGKADETAREALETQGYFERPSGYDDGPYRITNKLIEDGRKHLLKDVDMRFGCRMHILHGMADIDVPWTHTQALMSRLPHDDVALTYINDGDHRLSRDQDIDVLKQVLERMMQN